MSLANDLKTLQELHAQGKLTDQEYADAKAATLQPASAVPPAQKRSWLSLPSKVLILVLLVFLVIIGIVWYNAGTRTTQQFIATAVHAPITIEDEVENLPASSWRAVALNLPYAGTVNVTLQVAQGNPIDVYLTSPDQLDAMKRQAWDTVKVLGDFSATKTRTYKRTARLDQGSYYLVLRDTSLGILSERASDVSVKVQLNP